MDDADLRGLVSGGRLAPRGRWRLHPRLLVSGRCAGAEDAWTYAAVTPSCRVASVSGDHHAARCFAMNFKVLRETGTRRSRWRATLAHGRIVTADIASCWVGPQARSVPRCGAGNGCRPSPRTRSGRRPAAPNPNGKHVPKADQSIKNCDCIAAGLCCRRPRPARMRRDLD